MILLAVQIFVNTSKVAPHVYNMMRTMADSSEQHGCAIRYTMDERLN